jgi:sugar-specific transcriptional regulator TrmB
MTQEWLIKTLIALGFEKRDAEVYAFLSLNGAQKASAIAEAIGTHERQVYRSLKKLKKQKIVSGTEKQRAQYFVALSFDKLLDLLVKINLKEARQIEQSKESLMSFWRSWSESYKGNPS